MSAGGQTDVVTLAGDLAQGVWGVGVGPEPAWSLASFDGAAVAAGSPLEIVESATSTGTPGEPELLELCRVRGTVTVEGREREIDLPGVRCAAVSTRKLGSIRVLGTWLDGGRELALAAVRPQSASGQDRDEIRVVASGEEQPVVSDPRLSTTYDSHGAPRRVGVELWLGDGGLGDDDEGEQSPRRVAGESTGASLLVTAGSSPVDAFALQCSSGGETGAGVYALVRVAQ